MAITSRGLEKLGFNPDTDFIIQDDGSGPYISKWNSASPQPSEAEIETAHAEWKAEYDAQEYARKRQAEYPSIQECIHAILDDQLDALQAKRQAVKTKYPKG
mgnify:CR=1 FL=1|tara:strand:- start:300 stop:605 length:306 start_codon:yes stop_codon:yes gene_type:complete